MNPERNAILVTGAAGWLGQSVCAQLRTCGLRVLATDRVAAEGPWDEYWTGDLEGFRQSPMALEKMLQQADAVIHCAGYAHRPIETPEEVKRFKLVNVEGTRAVVEVCQRCGVERIVYISTIAGYDWVAIGGQAAREDGPLRPLTAYARTKLEAELIVQESGLDWRAVRLATVFGQGDRANFAKLARVLQRRRFVIPGRGGARKSVISIELAALVLVRLTLIDQPLHRLMNAALPLTPTLREVCNGFSAMCGFPKAASIPLGILRLGAYIGDTVSKMHPTFPLTTVNLQKLTTSTVVDTTRLYEVMPNLAKPTFEEALRPASEFYRNLNGAMRYEC